MFFGGLWDLGDEDDDAGWNYDVYEMRMLCEMQMDRFMCRDFELTPNIMNLECDWNVNENRCQLSHVRKKKTNATTT